MTTAASDNLAHCVRAFDFEPLFVDGLGWNYAHGIAPLDVALDGVAYRFRPVAEKAGFVVFAAAAAPDGGIPDYPTRRRLEAQVVRQAYENLIVFADAGQTRQVWHWAKRAAGQAPQTRERSYYAGQDGNAIARLLRQLEFTMDQEEAGIDITTVTAAVRQALDVERVTKRFYDRFQAELKAFQEFISGIAALDRRQWYASLMLNRLMFVYFIQQRGFLDGDPNYLRNRLRQVMEQAGPGQFQNFYRRFLRRLFHEGLGQPAADRAPELDALLGAVPFLNGGLFEVHDLEREHPDLDIPDPAFERVFAFFDAWQWQLDERPRRNDNEINPDVLGYIFEKYINQKQMGAYYTKEDITGYITRNTVIPWLLDAAQRDCPADFAPGGRVWQRLAADPAAYIYPAVGHGVTWHCTPDGAERRPAPAQLPDDIAAGSADPNRRAEWNRAAPPEFALPTETWREVIARRQRHADLTARLAAGAVTNRNELVTLNLDLAAWARDAVDYCDHPALLRAFWRALTRISILDPACGSGAFLFAALNILEPLYTAALERMRRFVDDAYANAPANADAAAIAQAVARQYPDFTRTLDAVAQHPSERYYILKTIVLNNLYGVDLMAEAVEICRLRLFLKLVAQLPTREQIEPLPDIDFNIRAGNTLVGFTGLDAVRSAMAVTPDGQYRALDAAQQAALASIEKDAAIASRLLEQFREQQTGLNPNPAAPDQSKILLKYQLENLRPRLNQYLAHDYGIADNDDAAYAAWQRRHQPFHWFVEFYEIMQRGGFDVVIGNPPYLEFREVDYTQRGFACDSTGAIHALMIEQGIRLTGKDGRMSMIVPIALTSTQRMAAVQGMLETADKSVWYANFAWRPGKLFETVNRALTIFVVGPAEKPLSYATGYLKWTKDDRIGLFDRIAFAEVPRSRHYFWVPKLSTDMEGRILAKMLTIPTTASDFMGRTEHRVFYRHTGGLYWKVFTDFAPSFYVNGEKKNSSTATAFSTREPSQVQPLIAALSSDIFWWWYTIAANLRDLTPADIQGFPVPESIFTDAAIKEVANRYLDSLIQNSTMLVRNQRSTGRTETQSFKISASKPVIDEIDRALARHYGLTAEELDFIINYDIKYRMGGND